MGPTGGKATEDITLQKPWKVCILYSVVPFALGGGLISQRVTRQTLRTSLAVPLYRTLSPRVKMRRTFILLFTLNGRALISGKVQKKRKNSLPACGTWQKRLCSTLSIMPGIWRRKANSRIHE